MVYKVDDWGREPHWVLPISFHAQLILITNR